MNTSYRFLMMVILSCRATFASVVHLDAEEQKRIGIVTTELGKAEYGPEAKVSAVVISPAPLIDLFRQSEAANVTAVLSREALARAERLSAEGELVARKDVDGAKVALMQDEVKVKALEDRILLEWGNTFALKSAEERSREIELLLSGHRILVRLTIRRQEPLKEIPVAAELSIGREDHEPLHVTKLFPAMSTDPVFQTQAFIGIIDGDKNLPQPGTQMKGQLELGGRKTEGWMIPIRSVIYDQNKPWIYRCAEAEGDFERIEVPNLRLTENGWFVDREVLMPGKIVVSGAQQLLSKETLVIDAVGVDE